jgi:hypothetical protein
MRRLLPLLSVVALLATGCGAGSSAGGTATLWVTRDRGSIPIVSASVPAGLTALQALERKADVETSYGGRFVASIEGLAGSLSSQHAWFYSVNGIEADVGATEYRLRPDDVLWWDYRSWAGSMRQPVVVGAFPEPFVHGYGGHIRQAVVRYASKKMRAVALGLANTIRAKSVEPLDVPVPPAANVLRIVDAPVTFSAELRKADGSAGSPVEFRISYDDARRLLDHPKLALRRYEGLG